MGGSVSLLQYEIQKKSIWGWQKWHKSSGRQVTFPTTAGYQEAHPTICQTALEAWIKNWIKFLLFSRFSLTSLGLPVWACHPALRNFFIILFLQLHLVRRIYKICSIIISIAYIAFPFFYMLCVPSSVRFHYSVFLEKRILTIE